MTLELSFDPKQFQEVASWLREKKARAQDLSVPFAQSKVILFQDVARHFQEAKGSKGDWPPLKWRKRKPLQDKGRLRNSFISASGKDFARVSTNVSYAPIHNFGGTIPERFVSPKNKKALHWKTKDGEHAFSKGHRIPSAFIPQREFMWISDRAESDLLEVFRNHFLKE